MREREGGGTLDYPGYDGLWRESSPGGNVPEEEGSTHRTNMLVGKGAAHRGGKTCHECGAWNPEASGICGNCGSYYAKRTIVDMRHTLEQGTRGTRAVQGMDARKVKTSYKSVVLSARTEQEGIKPVLTPYIPPAIRGETAQKKKAGRYGVYLAASFIALIVILIVVLALLISGYL